MLKFVATSMAALALVAAAPAAAQSASEIESDEVTQEQMNEFAAMMGGLFGTDPLKEEEVARLPEAQAVVRAMMPDGFYGAMMSDVMNTTMRPMMALFTKPEFVLGTRLDLDEETLGALDEETQTKLVALLDPAHDRRVDVMLQAVTGGMGEAFAALEAPMRDGLSKAYATRFDEGQLADIATFFATPTGSIYAKESMALFADPQVMQSMMQAIPTMIGSFGSMETAMKDAMESLPAERRLEDLDAAERARMADLLGVEVSALSDIVLPPKSMDGPDDLFAD